MLVKINECMGTVGAKELFFDVVMYKDVLSWASALVEGKTKYRPLDCRVVCNSVNFLLIEGGKGLSANLHGLAENLRQVPENIRVLPNDTICITADIFERELLIEL